MGCAWPIVVVVIVLLFALLIVVVGLVVAAVLGRIPVSGMAEPVDSSPFAPLPAQPSAEDIDELRFDQALRGYRMEQVDRTIDRLRATLADRDEQIARLDERIEHLERDQDRFGRDRFDQTRIERYERPAREADRTELPTRYRPRRAVRDRD